MWEVLLCTARLKRLPGHLRLPGILGVCRKADIEAQIERAQKFARTDEGPAVPQGSELHRDEADGQPLKIALNSAAADRHNGKPPIAPKHSAAFAADAG